MAMTIVVTRNVPARFRGFLASCMCEIAPGVYTAPRLNKAVRERVWAVLEDWFRNDGDQSIVMTWRDPKQVGGQQVEMLGLPRHQLSDHDGVFLTRRSTSDE